MIRIETDAWETMAAHAQAAYTDECCGALVGAVDGDVKTVTAALPLDNVWPGDQRRRYELRPEDLLRVTATARTRGLKLIGIYHSHPDCDAYFSDTDLVNSCPWYSFVVLSVKRGKVDRAAAFLPDREQRRAVPEALVYPPANTTVSETDSGAGSQACE